jgi:outer membrane PBP1 activator LpoA protein
VLPPEVRSVLIAVDRDAAGERAANAAGRRWRVEGRHVRFMVPDKLGDDAVDVLRAREAAHG